MDSQNASGLIGLGIFFVVALAFVWLLVRAQKRRRREFAEEERRDQVEQRQHPEETRILEEAAASGENETIDMRTDTAEIPIPVDAELDKGLERTRSSLWGKLAGVFGKGNVDSAVLDSLEEALITSDVGVGLASKLVDELRSEWKSNKLATAAAMKERLKERITEALQHGAGSDPLQQIGKKPRIILFVGVNGVGKTTTIGKIAQKLTQKGESVVLAAGDTFRAAAAEQLGIWADRTGAKIIRGEEGADPASVIFNAVNHANAAKADTVLADTAGRLHTKTDLMEEIRKVKRACSKARDAAPDETWLVVDSTTGQNALQQAKEFHQTLELTGVILTKLDGTAKGGVVIAIADALKVPVRFIGVGEKAEDLKPFDPRAFAEALFKE